MSPSTRRGCWQKLKSEGISARKRKASKGSQTSREKGLKKLPHVTIDISVQLVMAGSNSVERRGSAMLAIYIIGFGSYATEVSEISRL